MKTTKNISAKIIMVLKYLMLYEKIEDYVFCKVEKNLYYTRLIIKIGDKRFKFKTKIYVQEDNANELVFLNQLINNFTLNSIEVSKHCSVEKIINFYAWQLNIRYAGLRLENKFVKLVKLEMENGLSNVSYIEKASKKDNKHKKIDIYFGINCSIKDIPLQLKSNLDGYLEHIESGSEIPCLLFNKNWEGRNISPYLNMIGTAYNNGEIINIRLK